MQSYIVKGEISILFNTREWAIIFWVLFSLVFLIIGIVKSNRSKDSGNVIKSFIKLFQYPVIWLCISYLLFSFYLLYSIGYIKGNDLIKDYIKLTLFLTIPLIFKVITNFMTINIKSLIKDIIKVSTIFIFIVNEYTFSFYIELVITLLCIILIFVQVVLSEQSKQNEKSMVNNTSEVISILLGVLFIGIVLGALYKFSLNFDDVKSVVFWKKMLMDFLFIINIPLLIALKYIMYYQQIIIRIKIKTDLVSTFKGKIKVTSLLFRYYGINEHKLKKAF